MRREEREEPKVRLLKRLRTMFVAMMMLMRLRMRMSTWMWMMMVP